MSSEPLEALRAGHFLDFPAHYMHRRRAAEYLLIWVMGGRGFTATEGVSAMVEAGTLLTFAKGRGHRYGSEPDRPWNIAWVHFDGPMAGLLFRELRQGGGPVQPLALDGLLQERFLELVAARTANTPQHRRLANRLLWGVLGLMAHRLAMPSTARAGLGSIAAVQQHVQAHLAEPLTVSALADVAGLSPRHLSRLMSEAMGCSPMRYVIDQRMAQAAALLRESELAVKQVALAVGYEDPFHFTRLFHERIGCSPSAYRQREQVDRAGR